MSDFLQFVVPFGALTEWVKTKTGQEVSFSFVDEATINIGTVFKVTIPVINKEVSKEIGVKVSNIKLAGEDLLLHYDAGAMVNLLSSGIMKLLPASVIERGIVDFQDDTAVVVHLDRVEKAHQVLQQIDIQSIRFDKTAAIVDFTLRLA